MPYIYQYLHIFIINCKVARAYLNNIYDDFYTVSTWKRPKLLNINLLVPAGTLKYVKTGFVLSALKPVCRGPVRQVLLSLGRLTLGVH